MEKQELFASYGRLVDLLQEKGHHAFFEYSAHVDWCSFRVYLHGWKSGAESDFRIEGSDFNTHEAHLTKCIELVDFLITFSLPLKK